MSITETRIAAAGELAHKLLRSAIWRANYLSALRISEARTVVDRSHGSCNKLLHLIAKQLERVDPSRSVSVCVETVLGKDYGEDAFERLLLDLAKLDRGKQEDRSEESKGIGELCRFTSDPVVGAILRSSVFSVGNGFTFNQRLSFPPNWIRTQLRSAHEMVPLIAETIRGISHSFVFVTVDQPVLRTTDPGIVAQRAFSEAMEARMPWWNHDAMELLTHLDNQLQMHHFQHGSPCLSNLGIFEDIIDYETTCLLRAVCGMPISMAPEFTHDIHVFGPTFVESSQETPPVSWANVLGLVMDEQAKTLHREGSKFSACPPIPLPQSQWELLLHLLNAGKHGATLKELEDVLKTTRQAISTRKTALKQNLFPLDLTIPGKDFRIAEINADY